MPFVIEIKESSTQLVFGVPQFLSVTPNEPSDIFYTLDGSEPTTDSLVGSDAIYLPTDLTKFTFKCIAFNGSIYSNIFSKEYSVSTPLVKNTRKGNEGGVIIYEIGEEVTESFGYDYLGNDAQSITKVRDSVDFVSSTVANDGSKIPDGSSKDFVNFAKKSLSNTSPSVSSVNNNVNFNPEAKVIMIDGTTQANLDSQSVMIINRAYDTFSKQSQFYLENENKYRSIISGNLVKYVYNNQTGEITFYYYESVESRWIISKQKTDPKSFNYGGFHSERSRYVFRWINDPVMTKLT